MSVRRFRETCAYRVAFGAESPTLTTLLRLPFVFAPLLPCRAMMPALSPPALSRVALLGALALLGCGGGTRMVETGVAPVRGAPAQPLRDTAGDIVTQAVTMPDGTAFTVVTAQPLTSRAAAVGDSVRLEVADNLRVNGVVVVLAGTTVRAIVSAVERAARMGRSGSLSLLVTSTTAVDGQTVRLRAVQAAEADSRIGTTVAWG